MKEQVNADAKRLSELETQEEELQARILKIMMTIPNIIDPSVPIGKNDTENVEVQRYGEPVVPDFEIPYHTEIMESFDGIDLDSARKVAGNGFYYLMRLYLLCTSFHDQKQCCNRRYELCRNGRYDVQDRRRRSLPDRYFRAFHDR